MILIQCNILAKYVKLYISQHYSRVLPELVENVPGIQRRHVDELKAPDTILKHNQNHSSHRNEI